MTTKTEVRCFHNLNISNFPFLFEMFPETLFSEMLRYPEYYYARHGCKELKRKRIQKNDNPSQRLISVSSSQASHQLMSRSSVSQSVTGCLTCSYEFWAGRATNCKGAARGLVFVGRKFWSVTFLNEQWLNTTMMR